MRLRPTLLAIAIACVGVGYGMIAARRGLFPAPLVFDPPSAPKDRAVDEPGAAPSTAPVERSVFSIAYLRGVRPVTADRPSGITVNEAAASPGYNLVVSAHAPEVFLLDMKGRAVHHWWCAFKDIKAWKGESGWGPQGPPPDHPGRSCFRRAYLRPDGSLFVIFEDIGLVKLDADSNVVWAYRGGRVHHALDVDERGRIVALSKKTVRRDLGLDTFSTDQEVVEDSVVILSPDGELLDEISILDAFLASDHATVLEGIKDPDLLHTNSVEVIRGDHRDRAPMLVAGHLLLSFRHLNAVALLDPKTRRITWTLGGMFEAQHEASVVEDGRILLFDNRGNGGSSRAVEIDPVSQRVVWSYPERGEDSVFTETCGTCRRLRNGATLLTESENGRAVEVSREGDVVWEYYSERRYRSTKIATLYDVRRVYLDSLRFKVRNP